MLNQDDLRAGILIGSVIVASWALDVAPVSAEEPADKAVVTDSTKKDCRYEGIGEKSSANGGSSGAELLPENDVFRPLWADPKQPQFFATLQATKVRAPQKSYFNMGSVGFGENFGMIGKRNGCDGWQVGVLGGVFAQFDMDAASTALVNADYVIGIPVSFRSGLFSTRVRLFHQSSHLGDEFLLQNPGITRTDFSFEVLEAILSLDAPGGWGRVYAGGAHALHVSPSGLDRNSVHWGAWNCEARPSRRRSSRSRCQARSLTPDVRRRLSGLRRAELDDQFQCRWRAGMVQGWVRPSFSAARQLLLWLFALWAIFRHKARDGWVRPVSIVLIERRPPKSREPVGRR